MQVFGSMATGLAIESSDMDLLVQGIFDKGSFVTRDHLVTAMGRLNEALGSLPNLENNTFIPKASIPVIKLVS